MKKHFADSLIDKIDVNPDKNYFTPILNYIFKKFKPSHVCDIGCGNGNFTGTIKDKFPCKIVGIDGSKYALNQAKKLNYDDLKYISNFSIDTLKFKDESLDLVICKDVFEHLLDPEHLTKEIFRVLKPNGILLSHVPNHFPIIGRIKFLITNNIDTFNYFPTCYRYDFPHIRFFTFKSFIRMFEINLFKFEENLSHHFFKFPIIERFLPNILKKFLCKLSTDNFSEGITLILRK